jgi:hypothetical protein
VNVVYGLILLQVFWSKTLGHQMCYEQGHCYDARSKYQTEVQVFSDEQPHLTMPIFSGNSAALLFELVKEAESDQCPCGQENKPAHDMHVSCGLGGADIFHCML